VSAPLEATERVLQAAAEIAGIDVSGAQVIRDGSHAMYRLQGGVVARIGRAGTAKTAQREVKVADWLAQSGIRVTRTVDGLAQPVVFDDRPVTWWRLLPEHRAATPAELGAVLRGLHELAVPAMPQLPVSDPFSDLGERLSGPANIAPNDREWLQQRLSELRDRYNQLRYGQPQHVIHGDAWQGNVAVPPAEKPILLDLEHVSIGHADWDLIPLAVDYTDFARLDHDDYHSFVAAYGGRDVTTSPAFRTLADIHELRWVCFVISKSLGSQSAKLEVRHRIACLRGDVPRPWSWTAF
jgi:Ser/Thr protein kinase RdoA (MazF antagonist)